MLLHVHILYLYKAQYMCKCILYFTSQVNTLTVTGDDEEWYSPKRPYSTVVKSSDYAEVSNLLYK